MPTAIADIILDSLAEGVVTVDGRHRITAFNRAAERLTGLARAQVLGRDCQEVFGPCCGGVCIIAETLRTGEPLRDRPGFLKDGGGTVRPVAVTTNLLTDAKGRILGAVGTLRDTSRETTLEKELRGTWRFEDMVSRSPRMRRLFDMLPTVAQSSSTVLIQGESGTGKELLARALHAQSGRAEKPFVAVNCGALPDNLLEAELFGYRKGAFTDAKGDRPGRFERARGGTIFLDEIGEISQAMQVRLLRVLQERTFEPLGADAPVQADVRVLAATNRDLKAMVEAGTFRLDLYYRLNVVRLELPALRERSEDIPLLAEHFVDRLNRLQGRQVAGIDDDALAALARHAFRGNVRELENIIERAFVLCGDGPIGVVHLPDDLQPAMPAVAPGSALDRAEAAALEEALRRHRGNRGAVATELGIHRATLYRKMRQHGLISLREDRFA
ncbi:MAG: sigma 54-interacting transcriptional regulator [Planctomycetes bacterium]|nr:sigma 54-interacting transcriptional regulator [Planctomycetota bacterium]